MALGPGTSELTPTMIDPPRRPLRIDTVRRQFARRAARLGAHDVILREIERRLVERLALIKLRPRLIADIGCGVGAARNALLQRYTEARWLGIDACVPMLRARPRSQSAWARAAALVRGRGTAPDRVGGELGALPLRDDSIDLLFSNLALHWHPLPHAVFPEWLRVLRVDGLLMFSCFGPDTLKELRTACVDAGVDIRPMPFVDMHDFGDMMVAAGFATPVMDAETITLTFDSPATLLAEVRALGGNARDDRLPGLVGTRRARALLAALDSRRGADGRIALSFEVAYGHAWKPQPRARGQTRISVDHLRAQLRGR